MLEKLSSVYERHAKDTDRLPLLIEVDVQCTSFREFAFGDRPQYSFVAAQ